MAITDYAMIVGCRRGDPQAWQHVLDQYERLVFSIPLNYGLSREDAADIVQITFTSLLQSIDTIHDDSRLGAWLATVARRHTWRVIQRNKHEDPAAFALASEQAIAIGYGSAESLERWEMTEWLHHSIMQLNERCRELVLALYFAPEAPSYAELAERTGVPIGSIGPTRARCLERLKILLLKAQDNA